MASQPQALQTFEEYLELERKAEYRSEFHAGEIYAMSGGTEPHSRLSVQTAFALFQHFKGCRIYDSSLRLYISQADRCFYPDAMVLCGQPEFHDNHRDVIKNPLVVVEVLSPSTQRYDQGPKADYYRTVPTIQHILLISQDRVFIEHFSRQENKTWIITPYGDRNGVIAMSGVEIPIEEIYGRIFEE